MNWRTKSLRALVGCFILLGIISTAFWIPIAAWKLFVSAPPSTVVIVLAGIIVVLIRLRIVKGF